MSKANDSAKYQSENAKRNDLVPNDLINDGSLNYSILVQMESNDEKDLEHHDLP